MTPTFPDRCAEKQQRRNEPLTGLNYATALTTMTKAKHICSIYTSIIHTLHNTIMSVSVSLPYFWKYIDFHDIQYRCNNTGRYPITTDLISYTYNGHIKL